MDELVCRVYPDLSFNFSNITWLSERCILPTLNKTTHDINMSLIEALPGDCVEYKSIDTVPDETEAINFPTEFLNSLDVSGTASTLTVTENWFNP